MKYYRCKRDAYDYFDRENAIKDALYTEKERNTMLRYVPDDVFEKVRIKKTETYYMFGLRRYYEDAEVKMGWEDSRDIVEEKIYKKIREIENICRKYCPEDKYLTMCITDDGNIMFNNTYWDDRCKHRLNFHSDWIESTNPWKVDRPLTCEIPEE